MNNLCLPRCPQVIMHLYRCSPPPRLFTNMHWCGLVCLPVIPYVFFNIWHWGVVADSTATAADLIFVILWVLWKGACSTVAVFYLTTTTLKTLSFTFRVNAILSVRLHSTRTNPLAASLPRTFLVHSVKQSRWRAIRHSNLASWQQSPQE